MTRANASNDACQDRYVLLIWLKKFMRNLNCCSSQKLSFKSLEIVVIWTNKSLC